MIIYVFMLLRSFLCWFELQKKKPDNSYVCADHSPLSKVLPPGFCMRERKSSPKKKMFLATFEWQICFLHTPSALLLLPCLRMRIFCALLSLPLLLPFQLSDRLCSHRRTSRCALYIVVLQRVLIPLREEYEAE